MSNHSFIEWLVIAILASYRLSILLVQEDGPFDIFFRARVRIGVYDYGPDGSPKTMIGRLFACPLCLGIYISFAIALLMWPISARSILYGFAIAGGQSLLYIVSKNKLGQ